MRSARAGAGEAVAVAVQDARDDGAGALEDGSGRLTAGRSKADTEARTAYLTPVA